METGQDNEKIRENRLRRIAKRQGMALVKVRRRDPDAVDYRRYWLVDPSTNCVVSGFDGYNNTGSLDDVEEWLKPDTVDAPEHEWQRRVGPTLKRRARQMSDRSLARALFHMRRVMSERPHHTIEFWLRVLVREQKRRGIPTLEVTRHEAC